MELNVFKLILDAGPVVKLVMLLLVVLSVVSWAIIFLKVRTLRNNVRETRQFIDYFWEESNLDAAMKNAAKLPNCPVAQIFRKAYAEFKVPMGDKRDWDEIQENVERTLSRSIASELGKMESKTPFLATTGSAAPFIGLFGTVWGIMNSFLSIGAKGATNLAVVAPGISEALIATAIGLFAAIPAVIGYNYCQSKIRFLHREMTNFSNDFLNALKRYQKAS